MTRLFLPIAIVWTLVPHVNGQTVLYVNDNAAGANNGTDWPNAYVNLRTAISAAHTGDQVWVAEGVYKPDLGTHDRAGTFQLKNGVAIYGGFVGNESMLAQRALLFDQTVLSGDLLGNDDTGPLLGNATRSDNCYHVVTGSSTNNTAVLDGFTVEAGYAENFNASVETADRGGGLYISAGHPTIRNCRFVRNFAIQGGGIYDRTSNVQLTSCQFRENWASRNGGAMYNSQGSPNISHCEFRDNTAFSPDAMPKGTAYGIGGGIYNTSAHPTISDCLFTGNAALGWGLNPPVNSPYYGWGGAVVNISSNPQITNCQFIDNVAEGYAAGIQNDNTAAPVITNCLFEGNRLLGTHWWHTGGAAMNSWRSSPTVINTTFRNNKADHGGAIHSHGHGTTERFIGCRFINNQGTTTIIGALYAGGAIYAADGSHFEIINCLFLDNSALNGGAVYIREPFPDPEDPVEPSPTLIVNCTFSRNNSVLGAGGAVYGGSEITMRNCILWGNTASGNIAEPGQLGHFDPISLEYNTIQGWTGSLDPDAVGNIGEAPLFVDAANGDFHLSAGSPALDAGDPDEIVPPGQTDLDGLPRLRNCRIDQGAFESPLFADCDADSLPDGCRPPADCNANGRFDACEFGGNLDCNANGLSDLCDVFDGTSLDLNHTGTPDECDGPMIVHEFGLAGQTRPYTGFIDPLRESNDGQSFNQGIDRVALRFSEPVFHLGGGPVGMDSFEVTQTGGGAPPSVFQVDASANPLIVIRLNRPTTVREWTTVRSSVQSAAGQSNLNQGNLGLQVEYDRVDVAFLPADVNQDGRVTPLDLLRFKQHINGLIVPTYGTLADYVDVNRSGGVSPLDLLAFKQLINGVSPATQPWFGANLSHSRP